MSVPIIRSEGFTYCPVCQQDFVPLPHDCPRVQIVLESFAALAPYVQHKPTCKVVVRCGHPKHSKSWVECASLHPHECDCGLAEVLETAATKALPL